MFGHDRWAFSVGKAQRSSYTTTVIHRINAADLDTLCYYYRSTHPTPAPTIVVVIPEGIK